MAHILVVLGLLAPALAARGAAQGGPDAAGAVTTFFAARARVNGGVNPVPTPADVRAAAVVLRLHGRALGFGKDAGEGPADGIVERALQAALADARSRPRGKAMNAASEDALGTLLTLELELAGPREPLVGRTFEELARQFEPGECGLQLVDGTRTAYEPASHLLARRMAAPASRAVLAMIGELGLPPRDLPDLQALGGATALYASRGIRLAQTTPTATPFVLARVLPPIASEPASRADGARACTAAVARLTAQLDHAPASEGLPADAAVQVARTGLRGDYLIAADRYEPVAAPPAEQALAAWAMARAAATPSWPAELRDRSRTTARRVLQALADVDPSEASPTEDPMAVACTMLALAEDPQAALPPDFRAAAAATLRSAADPARLAATRPHVRALLLDAAASVDAAGDPVMERGRLEQELVRTLAQTPTSDLPWIAPFAIDALRRLHGAAWAARAAPAAGAIEAARTVLVATQVPAIDPARPPVLADLVGAFPVAGATAGRAGSQSIRAQHFVASVAAMDGRRSPTRDDEDRAALAWATRFLMQLQAPEAIACCGPAPDRAVGGVLSSTAEASQPLAAQAMAILALADTERALESLAKPATTVPGGSP